jgi:antitoxin component YwqK of YwqJK toxin-antitoxin module
MLHGVVMTLRDDGSRLEESTYEQGIRHGPYRDYWSTGALACEGMYVRGLQQGEWRYFDGAGTLLEVIQFHAGQEISKQDWLREADTEEQREL